MAGQWTAACFFGETVFGLRQDLISGDVGFPSHWLGDLALNGFVLIGSVISIEGFWRRRDRVTTRHLLLAMAIVGLALAVPMQVTTEQVEQRVALGVACVAMGIAATLPLRRTVHAISSRRSQGDA